jgi:hypothetical protein
MPLRKAAVPLLQLAAIGPDRYADPIIVAFSQYGATNPDSQ